MPGKKAARPVRKAARQVSEELSEAQRVMLGKMIEQTPRHINAYAAIASHTDDMTARAMCLEMLLRMGRIVGFERVWEDVKKGRRCESCAADKSKCPFQCKGMEIARELDKMGEMTVDDGGSVTIEKEPGKEKLLLNEVLLKIDEMLGEYSNERETGGIGIPGLPGLHMTKVKELPPELQEKAIELIEELSSHEAGEKPAAVKKASKKKVEVIRCPVCKQEIEVTAVQTEAVCPLCGRRWAL
jgi:hypothetical protein